MCGSCGQKYRPPVNSVLVTSRGSSRGVIKAPQNLAKKVEEGTKVSSSNATSIIPVAGASGPATQQSGTSDDT